MSTNNPPLYLMLPDRDPTRPLDPPPEPVAYPPGIEDADGILIVDEGEHNCADAPPPDDLSLEGRIADLHRRLAVIAGLIEVLPQTWPELLEVLQAIRRLARKD